MVNSDLQKSIRASDYDVLIVATRWKQFITNHHLEGSIKGKKSVFMYDLHNIMAYILAIYGQVRGW